LLTHFKPDSAKEGTNVKVKDLMIADVKYCEIYNTLNTAAQVMWDNDIGCVPIVDADRRVVGMLTDRDICMAAYIQGVSLAGALVTGAMSTEVFSCAPENDIATAEKLMREKQVRRLPVIDAHGRLTGVISLNDIAREAAREAEMKKAREVSDAEIARVMVSLCAPRHRVFQASA
jgi:CBS domain-containing protein